MTTRAAVHGKIGALPRVEAADQEAPARPAVKAAALSFVIGLFALRVCWLPGINCALALGALALGVVGALQVARSHGRLGGMEEAMTGIVMGLVVLAISVFFTILLVASLR